MVWTDVLLIIVLLICTILFGILAFMAISERDWGFFGGSVIAYLIALIFFGQFFVVIDKKSGATMGTVTSVDKNHFYTTAFYIKTTENKEEKYCIEDPKLAEEAYEYIGKKVKVTYGKRVGIYSTADCDQSPIEKIEVIND